MSSIARHIVSDLVVAYYYSHIVCPSFSVVCVACMRCYVRSISCLALLPAAAPVVVAVVVVVVIVVVVVVIVVVVVAAAVIVVIVVVVVVVVVVAVQISLNVLLACFQLF